MIPWIKYGGILLIVSGVIYKIYSIGYDQGSMEVQLQWNEQVTKTNQVVLEQKEKIDSLVKNHETQVEVLKNELFEADKKLTATVATLRANTSRLQQSEARANVYKRKANSGADQCKSLAEFAGKLDRSLTEGRALVEEFRATLEQRDTQLRVFGELIKSQQELLKD